MKRFNFPIVASLLLALTLLTGCATDQAVINNAVQANGQLQPAFITDPMLTNYLQQVGDRIIDSAKELDKQGFGPKSHKSGDSSWMFSNKMQFHFVNSKTVNAFTTGGEHMYVYNALFQMCKDEDELAAVMSHEYGHVYARHVAKGMNRQYAMLGVAAAAGAAGYAYGGREHGAQYAALGAGLGGAGAQFLNMGFTRGDEEQADWLGFNFYTHAGWDPNQFGAFFQDMINAGYDKTPAIMSDHPTLASRVAKTNQWVKELPPQAAQWRKPPVADPAKFRELQARAQQIAARTPDDTTLKNAQQLAAALPRSCIIPYATQDELQARQAIANRGKTSSKKKHTTANQAAAQPASPPQSQIIGRS